MGEGRAGRGPLEQKTEASWVVVKSTWAGDSGGDQETFTTLPEADDHACLIKVIQESPLPALEVSGGPP